MAKFHREETVDQYRNWGIYVFPIGCWEGENTLYTVRLIHLINPRVHTGPLCHTPTQEIALEVAKNWIDFNAEEEQEKFYS